jgi:excisionase family DNA binding protein
MIMTVPARDKLMSLTDVSEVLGIPIQTLYCWRSKGGGPAGYRVGRHVRYRREAVEAWLERRADERFLGAQYDSPEPGQPPPRWRPSQWSARCTGRAFQGMGSHASMGQEDRSRSEIA